MKTSEFNDVFVRLHSDLLVIDDSIMTDRHHASNGNYEDDDPQNQIGGIIPAFSLSGWLRHGMEAVVQERGGTACHPGEARRSQPRAAPRQPPRTMTDERAPRSARGEPRPT